MSRPTTDWSRPNRELQSACVSIVNLSASGFASSSVKPRPRKGWRPQRGEEGRRHHQDAKLLRPSSFGKRGRPSGKERRVLDRRRLRLAVQIVGDRHARLREPNQRIRVPHEDQPLRVRVRQRPEQNLVQEAENGGIGANSQRQRHHRHQGEDRLLAQRADGIAKVLHGALDESAAERVAARTRSVCEQCELAYAPCPASHIR